MPHKSSGNAVLCQQGWFEGKQAQDMIDTVSDLLQTLGPPCPDRGTDKLNCWDALLPQVFGQIEIEIRCIHTNEQVGWVVQQALFELAANPNNLAVVL